MSRNRSCEGDRPGGRARKLGPLQNDASHAWRQLELETLAENTA